MVDYRKLQYIIVDYLCCNILKHIILNPGHLGAVRLLLASGAAKDAVDHGGELDCSVSVVSQVDCSERHGRIWGLCIEKAFPI